MTVCPELHELHEFVDGQLTSERWQTVDRHQRDCGHCRDALRSIARLNRALMRPETSDLGPDFESDFRERLMSRMVSTDDVGRLRKLQRRDLVLAASLAALIVVAISLVVGSGQNPKTESADLPREQALRGPALDLTVDLRETLARFLDGLGPEGPGPNDSGLEKLSLRFSAAGRNLAGMVAEEVEVSAPDRQSAAIMTLARLGDSQSAAALQRQLDQNDLSDSVLKTALEALVLLKSELAPKRIWAAVDRLPLADSTRLLAACDSHLSRQYLAQLAQREAAEHPDVLAQALGAVAGRDISLLLLELSFQHQQTGAFVDALSRRDDALSEIRKVAFKSSESQARRELALAWLGRLKDRESRGILVSLTRDQALRGAAVAALAEMGGPAAVADLVTGLRVDGSANLRELLDANGAALSGLIRLGPEARTEIIAELAQPDARHRSAYILALGRVANDDDLERLAQFAQNSEFEHVAVAALVMMDTAPAREFITQLLRHRDANLRRLAREALEVLDFIPIKKRSWAGFA